MRRASNMPTVKGAWLINSSSGLIEKRCFYNFYVGVRSDLSGNKHAGRDTASMAPEQAVPLAILVWQASQCAPIHALHTMLSKEKRLSRARQQRPDHSPFFACNADPLAQGCFQNPAPPNPQSRFVHASWITTNSIKNVCLRVLPFGTKGNRKPAPDG